MHRVPRKKRPDEIDPNMLSEPALDAKDREDFSRGAELFNEGRFWHAHEAWEDVWKRIAADSRIFFQGLIQMAAAYHQLMNGKYTGMLRHCDNALSKLHLFEPEFLGVDVGYLCTKIEESKRRALELGKDGIEDFEPGLIPIVKIRRRS